jgi:hypothetical protein
MPKLILEFDLETEQDQYEDAINGTEWHAVVQRLDNRIRDIIKYAPEFATKKDSLEMAEFLRDKLHYHINELGLY